MSTHDEPATVRPASAAIPGQPGILVVRDAAATPPEPRRRPARGRIAARARPVSAVPAPVPPRDRGRHRGAARQLGRQPGRTDGHATGRRPRHHRRRLQRDLDRRAAGRGHGAGPFRLHLPAAAARRPDLAGSGVRHPQCAQRQDPAALLQLPRPGGDRAAPDAIDQRRRPGAAVHRRRPAAHSQRRGAAGRQHRLHRRHQSAAARRVRSDPVRGRGVVRGHGQGGAAAVPAGAGSAGGPQRPPGAQHPGHPRGSILCPRALRDRALRSGERRGARAQRAGGSHLRVVHTYGVRDPQRRHDRHYLGRRPGSAGQPALHRRAGRAAELPAAGDVSGDDAGRS